MLGSTPCNEILRVEGGERTDRSEAFADLKLLCGKCYESVRELNFPEWREFFSPSA